MLSSPFLKSSPTLYAVAFSHCCSWLLKIPLRGDVYQPILICFKHRFWFYIFICAFLLARIMMYTLERVVASWITSCEKRQVIKENIFIILGCDMNFIASTWFRNKIKKFELQWRSKIGNRNFCIYPLIHTLDFHAQLKKKKNVIYVYICLETAIL